ncbi:MAG: sugar phosphate isomerase/epimerase [Planctomycetes bacterium]|nr:sugar phosphate isomerase/epimerase [Planctomycetota bacterium]
MRICCGSVCYRQLTFEEMLKQVAEAGYRAVELVAIPTWIHVDLRKMNADELGRRIEDAGLELAAIYPGGVNCASPDKVRESVDYIKLAVDVAEELGVRRIVFTGNRRDSAPLSVAISGYKELAKYLEARGVMICLENHYQNQIEFPEDYKQILDAVDSDNFGVTIDTGHFTASKVDLLKLADTFGERIKHVHVKDHIGPESVPLGKGETNNAGLIRRLAQMEYPGFLSVEVEAKDHENNPRYAREALPYLEELVDKAMDEVVEGEQ